MQSDNRILDDLSKLATGAAGALQGLRDEIEALVRQRVEKTLYDLDVVPREEFEAVREMARKAREENEALEKRLAGLEAKLESQGTASKSGKSAAGGTRKSSRKGTSGGKSGTSSRKSTGQDTTGR